MCLCPSTVCGAEAAVRRRCVLISLCCRSLLLSGRCLQFPLGGSICDWQLLHPLHHSRLPQTQRRSVFLFTYFYFINLKTERNETVFWVLTLDQVRTWWPPGLLYHLNAAVGQETDPAESYWMSPKSGINVLQSATKQKSVFNKYRIQNRCQNPPLTTWRGGVYWALTHGCFWHKTVTFFNSIQYL